MYLDHGIKNYTPKLNQTTMLVCSNKDAIQILKLCYYMFSDITIYNILCNEKLAL